MSVHRGAAATLFFPFNLLFDGIAEESQDELEASRGASSLGKRWEKKKEATRGIAGTFVIRFLRGT